MQFSFWEIDSAQHSTVGENLKSLVLWSQEQETSNEARSFLYDGCLRCTAAERYTASWLWPYGSVRRSERFWDPQPTNANLGLRPHEVRRSFEGFRKYVVMPLVCNAFVEKPLDHSMLRPRDFCNIRGCARIEAQCCMTSRISSQSWSRSHSISTFNEQCIIVR